MNNKGKKKLLIKIYQKKCWLNFKVTEDNPLTYHHIKEDGKTDLENGALLSIDGHYNLNRIYGTPEYEEINRLFQLYKHTGYKEIKDRCRKLLNTSLHKQKKEALTIKYPHKVIK